MFANLIIYCIFNHNIMLFNWCQLGFNFFKILIPLFSLKTIFFLQILPYQVIHFENGGWPDKTGHLSV